MGIRRAEVIEVYNDLSSLTTDKIDLLVGRTKEPQHLPRLISPEESIRNMPRDSVRARIFGDDFSLICYPFFPSHLRLPVKVGEEVWILLENYENFSPTLFDPENVTQPSSVKDVVMATRNLSTTPRENVVVGYWMCRPTSERQIEDLNYTAFGRVKYASGFSMNSAADLQKNSERGSREPTFPYYTETALSSEKAEKEDQNALSRIRDFTPSFTLEPVARYTKLPGETVVAGSHDSRIVLGQTRTGGPRPGPVDSGAVDIVAGTGKGSTAPNIVKNVLAQEVDKDPALTGKQDVQSEGDPDLKGDASRILVSESIGIDDAFSSTVAPIGPADTDGKTGPGIAIRSQHVRILSSNDGSVRIVVEGPTQSSIVVDSGGNVQISAGNIVMGQSGTPQIVINGQTGEILVTGSRVKLGTITGTPGALNGVLTGPNIYSILLALRNDLLGSGATPPNPAAVIALPSTQGVMSTISAADPTLFSLFSKTVFASS